MSNVYCLVYVPDEDMMGTVVQESAYASLVRFVNQPFPGLVREVWFSNEDIITLVEIEGDAE